MLLEDTKFAHKQHFIMEDKLFTSCREGLRVNSLSVDDSQLVINNNYVKMIISMR